MDWKVIDHCSAVTRLYAIYEQFVHELIRAFLSFLESSVAYPQLDAPLRAEHRRMLGQVLINLDRERYQSLNFESIIGDLKEAFRSWEHIDCFLKQCLFMSRVCGWPSLGLSFRGVEFRTWKTG